MSEASTTQTDGDLVRAFYDAYSDQAPERFATIVAEDYLDHGHEPPGRGPQGAHDDFNHAAQVGGPIRYEIEALVDDGAGSVAAVWTARMDRTGEQFRGLGLYRVRDHRLAETHNALIGPLPKQFL